MGDEFAFYSWLSFTTPKFIIIKGVCVDTHTHMRAHTHIHRLAGGACSQDSRCFHRHNFHVACCRREASCRFNRALGACLILAQQSRLRGTAGPRCCRLDLEVPRFEVFRDRRCQVSPGARIISTDKHEHLRVIGPCSGTSTISKTKSLDTLGLHAKASIMRRCVHTLAGWCGGCLMMPHARACVCDRCTGRD